MGHSTQAGSPALTYRVLAIIMWDASSNPLVYGRYRMNIGRSKSVVLAFAFAGLAGCADSTGPGSIDDADAMRSLSLGLRSTATMPLPLSPSGLGTGAHGIDRIDVVINGVTQSMYALGLRVTYPVGTCLETIIGFSTLENLRQTCTAPPLGLVLALWQTRSGSRPPDRMVLVVADVGTAIFSPDFGMLATEGYDYTSFPPFAIHVNAGEEFWMSVGGTLNSQVTATTETCDVPAPPFAKSSTCNVATFAEAGQITFERFDFTLFGPGGPQRQTMELVIPSQSVRGILQGITEIQPIAFPGDWSY